MGLESRETLGPVLVEARCSRAAPGERFDPVAQSHPSSREILSKQSLATHVSFGVPCVYCRDAPNGRIACVSENLEGALGACEDDLGVSA